MVSPVKLGSAVSFGLSIGLVTLFSACEWVAVLERVETVGADAAPDQDSLLALAVEPCAPRPPPAKPGDLPRLETMTFAVRWVEAPVTSVPAETTRLCPDPSFDMDDRASCFADRDGQMVAESCRPWTTKEKCDVDPSGRDNSGRSATGRLTSIGGLRDEDPNPELAVGKRGVLVEVSSYNGGPDDAEVSVSVMFAVGVDDGSGEPRGVPKWDGSDKWLGEPSSFLGEEQPRYLTNNAHVVGDTLVATFERTPLPSFGGAGLGLEARTLILTGRIVRGPTGEPVRLDYGRLGARITVETALRYFGSLSVNGQLLCTPGFNRDLTVRSICEAADLGPGDPASSCDAISFAAGFYAERAQRAPKAYRSGFDTKPLPPCPFTPWPITCADL